MDRRVLLTALGVTMLAAAQPPNPPEPPQPPEAPETPETVAPPGRYETHAELSDRVARIAAEHPRACVLTSIGSSRAGREIHALRLALPGGVDPDRRGAMLLAANIDGSHVIGSAVALAVVEALLDRAAAGDEAARLFLTDHTLYVVPRVNPDAAEDVFAEVRTGRDRNLRPDDRDRDGAADEDPPNDLNGDGLITMMRVYDPEKADMMADPDEPRLNARPDRDEGQRADFRLEIEGIDDDGDGERNEDGVGGVDLNMNYMHGYQEHADGAGPFQVSEPESRALLEYVLAHQNIAVVLVYGKQDNLSSPPDGKGTYPWGAPKTIDEKDAGLYKFISGRFTEITGLKKVAAERREGAFYAWAYAQFGVPSFTTPLWTHPAPEKKKDGGDEGAAASPGEKEDEPGEEGLTPSGIGDISQETLDELRAAAEARGIEVSDEMLSQLSPAMVENFAARSGIKVRRVKTARGGKGAGNKEDAAWLAYSDEQRGGEGFIDWEPLEHPDLGRVEIGGWVPGFRTNPPPSEIGAIAGAQVEFILDLAGRFPEVALRDVEVTRLAAGLYEVKAALVNDGYLPTGTAMAVRNRRARPYVVRLGVPDEQVVTGDRVSKIWSIPGSGGREQFRWIIRAEDGSRLAITVYSEKFGEFERSVTLRDQGGER